MREIDSRLHTAVRKGNLVGIQRLLDEGADVNASADGSCSALHTAYAWNRLEVVELLLRCGADVNLADHTGRTLLMQAASRGDSPLVERLIAHEAGRDTRDPKTGRTALMSAACRGHVGVVRLLIEARADPGIPDNTGLTPVQLARAWGKKEVETLLQGAVKPPGPPSGEESRKKYLRALGACSDVASCEYEESKKALDEASNRLNALNQATKDVIKACSGKGREVANAKTSLEDLAKRLEEEFLAHLGTIKASQTAKKRHLKRFTVTLFGRTMAGKSTIREAITCGDGSTIGKGAQRTTRDVCEYEWNHLRIIDTPGIGAYEGTADKEAALSVVDESDVVLFLVSSDSIQEESVEGIRLLRGRNKPMVFVLNVKYDITKTPYLKRFLKNPGSFFSEEKIGGHIRRIERVGREELGLQTIRVVPIHAMAAFLATRPECKEHSKFPEQHSRIHDLLALLTEEVISNGTIRRLSTLLDGTVIPLTELADRLGAEAKQLNQSGIYLKEKFGEIEKWFKLFKADAERRIETQAVSIFGKLRREAGPFIDEHLEKSNVNELWGKKVAESRINEHIREVQDAVVTDFKKKIADFVSEIQMEMTAFKDLPLRGPACYNPLNLKRLFGWVSAGASALAGIATVSAYIAASNWWNPVGIGAAVVAVVTGIIRWFISNREDRLRKKREETAATLRRDIDEQKERVMAQVKKWFHDQIEDRVFHGIRRDTTALWEGMLQLAGELTKAQRELVTIVDRLNLRVVSRTAELRGLSLPVRAIAKVARDPGYKTKVLWLDSSEYRTACSVIGDALGEAVEAVPQGSLHAMVAQALAPAGIDSVRVHISDGDAVVRIPSSQMEAANGPMGMNASLASRLLQIRIIITAEDGHA